MTFLQPDLERVIRDSLADQPNVDMRLGYALTGLTDGPNGPVLTLRDRETGTPADVSARFVVGCDGGNSFVRKSLGIAFEDLGFDEPWLVVDMLVEETGSLPEVNIQFCDPARPHTYVVGPGSQRRWEFMLMPGEASEDLTGEDRIWSLLAPWLARGDARIWRAATYRFHALVAETWRSGNIFLAGDACHMTPPFLAQGMVQGIKDAANLAWKLAAVLEGAAPDLLDTYEQERRPLVRDVISITRDLGRVICEIDPAKAEERNARMRRDMAEGRGVSVRQDLFPPLAASPLCLEAGGAAVGRPAPQPRVALEGGWALLDHLTGHRFVLLAVEGFGLSERDAETARHLDVPVVAIGDGPGLLREEHGVFADWMAAHGARAILVRPDHIVMAAMAEPDEVAGALCTLARQLRSAIKDPQ